MKVCIQSTILYFVISVLRLCDSLRSCGTLNKKVGIDLIGLLFVPLGQFPFMKSSAELDYRSCVSGKQKET